MDEYLTNILLKEIFKAGELDEKATAEDFSEVQKEGNREYHGKRR